VATGAEANDTAKDSCTATMERKQVGDINRWKEFISKAGKEGNTL